MDQFLSLQNKDLLESWSLLRKTLPNFDTPQPKSCYGIVIHTYIFSDFHCHDQQKKLIGRGRVVRNIKLLFTVSAFACPLAPNSFGGQTN